MGNDAGRPDDAGYLDEVAQSLAASSTHQRLAGLARLHQKLSKQGRCIMSRFLARLTSLAEVTQNAYDTAIKYLFRTYSYYEDRSSRRAVQDFLHFDEFYPPKTSTLIQFYERECSRQGIAASNALVLAEWGSKILQYLADKPDEFKKIGPTIIQADAKVLEVCLRPRANARASLRRTALRATERAILTTSSSQGHTVIKEIVEVLTIRGHGIGQRAAPFLGATGNACAAQPSLLDSSKSQIYAFYTREILGSRTQVPTHIASGLDDFFTNFATVDDINVELVPALERALLRAPEVVLNDLITPFARSIPKDIDLASIIAKKLLKPIITHVKSQNESVRNPAVSAYRLLVAHSLAEEPLSEIIEQLLGILLHSKAPIERQSISQMLEGTPSPISQSNNICKELALIITKETSEKALEPQIGLLFKKALHLLPNSNILIAVGDLVSKGAKDKKPSIRRLWVLKMGDYIWSQVYKNPTVDGQADSLVQSVWKSLHEGFKEILKSPMVAVQNGILVIAFILTALWPKFGTVEQPSKNGIVGGIRSPITIALENTPQTSFLLNSKIYSKVDAQDFPWLIRALSSCCVKLSDTTPDVRTAWGEAVIFTIVSAGLPHHLRSLAMESLTAVYRGSPQIVAEAITQALWKWHNDALREGKETPAIYSQTGTNRLSLVLHSICPFPQTLSSVHENEYEIAVQDQLINLIVLCRPEIIPGAQWIQTCIRMGQDPGMLVQSRYLDFFKEIDNRILSDAVSSQDSIVKIAAFSAAAELAFVCPTVITHLLVERIQHSLSHEDVNLYGPTEIAIARTLEGTAFVDVLSTQTQRDHISKNSADYEITKWEEEMRNRIAQKRGQDKKLNADQRAKIDAQLQVESEIRRRVRKTENDIRRGAGYIYALATGPPSDARIWIWPSLTSLLDVIAAGAGRLVGDAADLAYLACSKFVTIRLGIQRRFIGVATLRAVGSNTIPVELIDEPLKHLVTRLLHRIHFLGGQRRFDVVSISYILPLIFSVLKSGGLGECATDEADEQVTLALEFLELHTNEFSDDSLPRDEIFKLLIACMQRFNQHYKLIKDCLLGITSGINPLATSPETKVLLDGVLVPQQTVRTAVLQAIREHVDLTDLDFCEQIWLASHDDIDENVVLGRLIWEENALDAEPSNALQVMPYLASLDNSLRSAASRALAECLGSDRAKISQSLHEMEEQYRQLAKPRLPEKDSYGMPKNKGVTDLWQARSGIALAFKEMAPIFTPTELVPFTDFLIKDGALGDRNAGVRDQMIDSATAVIALHGASKLEDLMHKFETVLDNPGDNSSTSD